MEDNLVAENSKAAVDGSANLNPTEQIGTTVVGR